MLRKQDGMPQFTANFQLRFHKALISAFRVVKILFSVCNVFEKTNRISCAFSFCYLCFFSVLSLSSALVFLSPYFSFLSAFFMFPLQFEIMTRASLPDLSRSLQVVDGVSR